MHFILSHLHFNQAIKNTALAAVIGLLYFFIAVDVSAKPKYKSFFGYSLQGFARVQVKNETSTDLACWVAIDGHKIKFRLPALNTSQWYTATDKRFNYQNFSTWCDYIDLHPEYQKYNRG